MQSNNSTDDHSDSRSNDYHSESAQNQSGHSTNKRNVFESI